MRTGSGRLLSVKSESTTIYMITLFLLAATLNSIIALFVMAIAALCRMGANHHPDTFLSNTRLYLSSWSLTAIYFVAAYFGYGIFSLPVITGMAKFSLKLTRGQTLLFAVLAGVLFVCLNLLLALALFYFACWPWMPSL